MTRAGKLASWLARLLGDGAGAPDEMAVLSVLGVLTGLGLEVFSVVVRHAPFDFSAFGAGLGVAIAAAASGMGLKAKLTPGPGSSAANGGENGSS